MRLLSRFDRICWICVTEYYVTYLLYWALSILVLTFFSKFWLIQSCLLTCNIRKRLIILELLITCIDLLYLWFYCDFNMNDCLMFLKNSKYDKFILSFKYKVDYSNCEFYCAFFTLLWVLLRDVFIFKTLIKYLKRLLNP